MLARLKSVVKFYLLDETPVTLLPGTFVKIDLVDSIATYQDVYNFDISAEEYEIIQDRVVSSTCWQ